MLQKQCGHHCDYRAKNQWFLMCKWFPWTVTLCNSSSEVLFYGISIPSTFCLSGNSVDVISCLTIDWKKSLFENMTELMRKKVGMHFCPKQFPELPPVFCVAPLLPSISDGLKMLHPFFINPEYSTVKLHKGGLPLTNGGGHPFPLLLGQPSSALLSTAQCPGRWPTVCQNRLGHQNYYFWGC